MKTAAQASKMWCPMIRSRGENALGSAASVNTYDEAFVTPTCYAEDCMMWRWTRPPKLQMQKMGSTSASDCFEEVSGWVKDGAPWHDKEEAWWVQEYTRETDPTLTGYCGLAGVPR